jgi:hypothetical protein
MSSVRSAAAERRRSRRGFTVLVALVVLVASLCIAAAVVTTHAAVTAERQRVNRTLDFVQETLTKGITLFEADVNGRVPGRLSDLSTAITGTRKNLCGGFYTTVGTPADVDEWSGKYAPRVYEPTGVPAGIGIASDTLLLEVVSGVTRAVVVIREVPLQAALHLDALVDSTVATSGSTLGLVQWGATDASGLVTVRFAIPVNACTVNSNPTASFTWACAQLTCTFTGVGTDTDGTIVSYSWTFGDATTSALQSPTKTYASGGTRTVTLTVTDNGGGTGNASQNVTARNIVLSGTGRKQGSNRFADLTWTGAVGTNVDVYRDGVLVLTTPNDGAQSDAITVGTFTYRICEQGTNTCSNTISVTPP